MAKTEAHNFKYAMWSSKEAEKKPISNQKSFFLWQFRIDKKLAKNSVSSAVASAAFWHFCVRISFGFWIFLQTFYSTFHLRERAILRRHFCAGQQKTRTILGDLFLSLRISETVLHCRSLLRDGFVIIFMDRSRAVSQSVFNSTNFDPFGQSTLVMASWQMFNICTPVFYLLIFA